MFHTGEKKKAVFTFAHPLDIVTDVAPCIKPALGTRLQSVFSSTRAAFVYRKIILARRHLYADRDPLASPAVSVYK